jgi:hypothetical protein
MCGTSRFARKGLRGLGIRGVFRHRDEAELNEQRGTDGAAEPKSAADAHFQGPSPLG